MKKHAYILIITALFAVVSIFALNIYIDDQSDVVSTNVNTVFGDIKHAEGINIRTDIVSIYNLYWEIVQNFDENLSTEVDFDIRPYVDRGPLYYQAINYESSSLTNFNDFSSGTGSSSGIDLEQEDSHSGTPMKHFIDIAENTKNSEEKTEIVNLADYYEYFPVFLYYLSVNEEEDVYDIGYDSTDFTDFFKIPIDASLQLESTVRKDHTGKVVYIENSPKIDESLNTFNLHTANGISTADTYTKDHLYVYMKSKGMSEYGIFSIPFNKSNGYRIHTDENGNRIDLTAHFPAEEGAFLLHQTDENADVLDLKVDEKNNNLIVIYKTDDIDSQTSDIYLKIIDIDTREVLQDFILHTMQTAPINSYSNSYISLIKNYDDFYYILFNDGTFKVLTEKGGVYEISLFGDMNEVYDINNQTDYTFIPVPNTVDIDYKDGEIAILSFEPKGEALNLALFDTSGLKYFANLENGVIHNLDKGIYDGGYMYIDVEFD